MARICSLRVELARVDISCFSSLPSFLSLSQKISASASGLERSGIGPCISSRFRKLPIL